MLDSRLSFFIRLEARLQPSVGLTLRRVLAVFVLSFCLHTLNVTIVRKFAMQYDDVCYVFRNDWMVSNCQANRSSLLSDGQKTTCVEVRSSNSVLLSYVAVREWYKTTALVGHLFAVRPSVCLRVSVSIVLGLEPTFDSASVNVTVIAGQTARLPCFITYLGKYKVRP